MEDAKYMGPHTDRFPSLKGKVQDSGLNNAPDLGGFRKARSKSGKKDHQVVRQRPFQHFLPLKKTGLSFLINLVPPMLSLSYTSYTSPFSSLSGQFSHSILQQHEESRTMSMPALLITADTSQMPTDKMNNENFICVYHETVRVIHVLYE